MHALILAGGSGTRFWPLSRRLRPKQLLGLDAETSLLHRTVERLAPVVAPEDVWICTTEALRERLAADVPQVPSEQVLAEPEGRNTAPALGWAIDRMPEESRDDVIAVLPADHRVGDPAAFRAALERAARQAETGRVATLGIRPRWAETGYGYLELGDELEPGVRAVRRFTEKPSAETARAWLEAGSHLWNGGIFVVRGSVLREHLDRFAPEIGAGLAELTREPERSAEIYARLPSISIDYAVMERLSDLVTVTLDAEWSDLGSWEALGEVLEPDAAGNGVRGDVLALDATDNLLVSDSGTVAVLGVSGLVVVRTGDAVLVLPRERSQDVRAIVDALAAGGRTELL